MSDMTISERKNLIRLLCRDDITVICNAMIEGKAVAIVKHSKECVVVNNIFVNCEIIDGDGKTYVISRESGPWTDWDYGVNG